MTMSFRSIRSSSASFRSFKHVTKIFKNPSPSTSSQLPSSSSKASDSKSPLPESDKKHNDDQRHQSVSAELPDKLEQNVSEHQCKAKEAKTSTLEHNPRASQSPSPTLSLPSLSSSSQISPSSPESSKDETTTQPICETNLSSDIKEKKDNDSLTSTASAKNPPPKPSRNESTKPIDVGAPLPLKNLGNTCYENSIIQCLFSLTSFMYDFKQKMQVALDYSKDMSKVGVEFKIAEAFHRLYDGYLSKNDLESKLNELKTAVGKKCSQFNTTHQQDASEFFYHVIDSIQDYFQSIDNIHDEKNPITRSFELELNSYVACVRCGHKTSTVSEKIRTLSLTIPDDEKKNGDNRGDSPSKPDQSTIIELTLQNALVNYFRDDMMEFKCSEADCDSKEKTRKCMIKKLPEVLFMTLARYSHSGQKNLEEIEAPFEIYVPVQQHRLNDVDESIVPLAVQGQTIMYEDDNKYQLVAVVCHLGPSLNTGHYTSFVYNQENGFWYSCDDDAVTKAETKQVEREARRSGYCFFYAHKSTIAHPQLLELSLAKSKSPTKTKATLTNGTTTTSSTPILANGLNRNGDLRTLEISHRRTKSSTSISSTASAMSSSESIELTDNEDGDSSDSSSLSSESSSSSSTSSQSSISLNLANLSERSASDRCMTAGCKLFGDKETNYWLCAICFELQKQELQSYHSEREKT